MNQKQAIGNAFWLLLFCAALTSPFWGHWLFGLGVVLMAIAGELRKEVPVRSRASMRSGPRMTTHTTSPLLEKQPQERV